MRGPQPVDGGQGIDLPAIGQIEGNALGGEDLGVLLELGQQLLGRRLLLGRTQIFAALTNQLAQGLTFGLGLMHGEPLV